MSDLPDEIVAKILEPVLEVSDEVFCDISPAAFEFRSQISTSAILLVCRQWLRVATPLLFEVVILRSSGQARALARVLKANKQFGQVIRKLRVEGGFGMALETIILAAPKIKDLYLSLSISSSDNVQGLCHALPSLDPCRLVIHENLEKPRLLERAKKVLDNAKTKALTKAVCDCIVKKWMNLRVCYVPYAQGSPRETPTARANALSAALRKAPSLETIVLPYSMQSLYLETCTMLDGFAANPGLKMAHILASHNDASGFASRLDRMPHIAELIVYQDPRPQRPPIKDCREDNIEDMSWVAGSYACLAASPQDVRSSIWTRILFFAMGKDGKHSIIRTCERFPGSMPNEGQWQFLLICKQLYELALPLLYHSPVITGLVGLQSLSRKLSTQLSLGSEIRLLMLYRGIASRSEILGQPELDDDYLSEVHQLVKNILTKAPNLQQLLTYERAFYIYSCPPFIMDWAALKTLCNIAGSSLHTLHGFQMKDEGQKSLSLFHDMIAIRSLEWYSRTVFHEDDGVLPTCLSSLEVLTLGLYDDSLLSALTKVNLPRLRSAVFQQVSNKNTSRSLRDFLEKHGSKLQHLEMVVPGLKIRSLFKWCPNLIRLVIKTNCLRPDFSAGALISLIHGGGSSKLRAMIIQDENFRRAPYCNIVSSGAGASQVIQVWAPFFAELDLSSLPALEGIQITSSLWPTNQRAYAKNPWIKWDSELKRRWDVGLLDEYGRGWTARIK